MMKIEIWSDVACPFCYIGIHNLEKALTQFPYKDQFTIEYKSFELEPDALVYDGTSYLEKLTSTFENEYRAKRFMHRLTQQAKSVGLTVNFDGMKPTNTFNAHRLAKWAKAHGKEIEVNEKLLSAYFTEAKDVGDFHTLAHIAEEVGLDREEAIKVLRDKDLYSDNVREDQSKAKEFGITGVPYFVFNGKYALSGAQPTVTFLRALDKVWKEG